MVSSSSLVLKFVQPRLPSAYFPLFLPFLLFTTMTTRTVWALSCRDPHAHTEHNCAEDGAGEMPLSTGTGCCCPTDQRELREHFGTTFADAGMYGGFCKLAVSADQAQMNLELHYKTRCNKEQAAQLYNTVCTLIGQAAAGVQALGDYFSGSSRNFADNTASADCKKHADEKFKAWKDPNSHEHANKRTWLFDNCPCEPLESELPPALAHCKREGYCNHITKLADPRSAHCNHGEGVGNEGNRKFLAGQKRYDEEKAGIDARAAERYRNSGAEERHWQKKNEEEEKEFLRLHPGVQINHDLRTEQQKAQDRWDRGQRILKGVDKCCGNPSVNLKWRVCSKAYRTDREADYHATYCNYYHEHKNEQHLRSGAGVGTSARRGKNGHERALPQEDVAELKGNMIAIWWQNMYPTDKQLQSLIDDGVVSKRTMGKYKPGQYFGDVRNYNKPGETKLPGHDFEADGWQKLKEMGYHFGSDYILTKPDGTMETRLPCKDSVCSK